METRKRRPKKGIRRRKMGTLWDNMVTKMTILQAVISVGSACRAVEVNVVGAVTTGDSMKTIWGKRRRMGLRMTVGLMSRAANAGET